MRTSRVFMVMAAMALFMAFGCSGSAPQTSQDTGVSNTTTPQPTQVAVPTPAPAKGKAKLPGGGMLPGEPTEVGFIFWGGDIPMFYCNGGLQTREGTICAQYGLNLKMFPGDDFGAQLTAYKAGQRQVLRGTFDMVAKHVEDLCQTPDLCPQMVVLMTKSKGDHLVCRENVKTVSDLKGKTIAIQKDGPHEKFLYVILTKDAGLKWTDVKIEWLPNINGPNSPPELFAKNPSVDCAFAVTPDMIGLSGGVTGKCDGAECKVKGSHVLVSTAHRTNTIGDVYAVSSKFARENPDFVRNFTAAYLKSVDAVIALRHKYEGAGSEEFSGLMNAAVDIWTPAVLPNEQEAYGLYTDAAFAGHAGNVAFFDRTNTEGIQMYSQEASDLAIALGLAKKRHDTMGSPVDWSHAVFSGMASATVKAGNRLKIEATRAEIQKMSEQGVLGDNASIRRYVYFEADETSFDPNKYAPQFDEVLAQLKAYKYAPVVVIGHMDSLHVVSEIIRAGMRAGEIKQDGNPGNYTYSRKGVPLATDKINDWLALLEQPGYATDREGNSLSEVVREADRQSLARAEEVHKALVAYARTKGVKLDESQLQVSGSGVRDPFIAKPRSPEESAKNRSVEFAVIRVTVESATPADYEL